LDLSYNSEAVFGDIIKIEKFTNITDITNIVDGCEEIYLIGTIKREDAENGCKGCFEAKVVVNLQNL